MTAPAAPGASPAASDDTPPSAHSLYLDISCVRIQRYLSRAGRLRGRRGASAAIRAAGQTAGGTGRTAPSTPSTPSAPSAVRNPEAGTVDGVISLRLHPAPAREEDADAAAREIAAPVLRRLRAELPAGEFHAVWGTGSGYLDAYHRVLKPRLERGDVLTDLPPVPELPCARTCEECHLDPAQREFVFGREDDGTIGKGWLCPDCLMRFSREIRDTADTAEEELRDALGLGRCVDTLAELAALGATAGNPDLSEHNHIATVHIDGNSFGAFFDRLAEAGPALPPEVKRALSRDLAECARDALAEAALTVFAAPDGDTLAVVPHLVGGDDVLVSLPAGRAWRFTRAYLAEFGRRAAAARAAAAELVPDGLPELSASAGLVFARHKEPFHLVVEEAGRRLKAAKQAVRGEAAAIAFADLTTGDTTGEAVSLAVLEQQAAALDALAALPASFRSTLTGILSRAPGETATAVTTARRLGHHRTVAPFASPGSPITLPQALRTIRWWR
ncbi:Cas10/Cmr2 second palm domain-containing protein [Streptomyces aidingensis]|uniref:Cas10/Cmr2 second palm domain-containing protein n=1 Tax=Streptomyces aidingensis TaxID=910347 RepID=A0A1I1NIE6_9ACTN|nr:hypothetical protein [Streptomyces aidingensis]SFC97411.1 hypothetical protein SAMN05421773_10818 [Streptomyces aidingensis]